MLCWVLLTPETFHLLKTASSHVARTKWKSCQESVVKVLTLLMIVQVSGKALRDWSRTTILQSQCNRSSTFCALISHSVTCSRNLASIGALILVSTAECERAFSSMNRIKTQLRKCLKITLELLLRISLGSPQLADFNFKRAADIWGRMRMDIQACPLLFLQPHPQRCLFLCAFISVIQFTQYQGFTTWRGGHLHLNLPPPPLGVAFVKQRWENAEKLIFYPFCSNIFKQLMCQETLMLFS
jgi:hypothetical protein